MGLISTAYAGTLQQTIAPRQELLDYLWLITAMAMASIVVSYGVTHRIKRWRKEHGKRLASLNNSEIRATLIAAALFLSQWFGAVELDIIRGSASDAIMAPLVLAIIVGVASPFSWPHVSKITGTAWTYLKAYARKKLGIKEPEQ